MNKRKSILLWTLAVLLTLVISVYQRMTGPTHPARGEETFKGKTISYTLYRSYYINEPLPVELTAPDPGVTAYLSHKRYKTGDPFTEVEMKREGDLLVAGIPGEKMMAAKVEYTIRVVVEGESFPLYEGKNVVARFKGRVPKVFLFIHILLMLFSIIFALRTGMEALRKEGRLQKLVLWTLVITFVGGMFFGPLVQWYSFGDWWTGFPFGTDLTDNKTLIAVVFWFLAFFLMKKSRWWVVLAAVVMIGVYLIPHSVLGSEVDYETGKMKNKYSRVIHYTPAPPGLPPGTG